MENTDITGRNYNTISPSAKSLLLMKGYTNIPFARQTAELIQKPKKYEPDFANNDTTFWMRLLHFENRYWSIDQLLLDVPVKNILELSSGFSFRGLETVKQKGFYYIDTDLPDVIKTKTDFVDVLTAEDYKQEGTLEILPLNALDENRFKEIVNHFPKGEIAIVNEGLLMYLDIEEKEKLCKIIHAILKERGGYWITADIYLKNTIEKLNLKIDDKTKEFFEQHKIEDNRFQSFEEAEELFRRMGFIIDKEAETDRSKLSSLKYFVQNLSGEQLTKADKAGKIHTTWRLRVA
jgi:O-Methyltransferase involved in polyketide biosynthesis